MASVIISIPSTTHSYLNLLIVITFKVMEAVLSTFHRLTWIPQSTPVSLDLTMVLHIPDCIYHKLQVTAAVLMASLLDRCASGKYNSDKPAPKKIHCKFLFRAKTTQEKVIDGLLGKEEKRVMEICDVPGKGRAVFLREPIAKDTFVLEYKTSEVYPRRERQKHEDVYELNNEGCMILEVETSQGWFCLDATRRHNTLGRLMNHAPPRKATLRPFKPLFVKGKWRVGFIAVKDLDPNTELTWDYGCVADGQEWLMKRPPKKLVRGGCPVCIL